VTEKTRVDVWLWAVRIYKTRSEATAACRGGHVRVNRGAAKASTQVKVGDRIDAFVGRPRILEVATVIEKRVGAAVAAWARENLGRCGLGDVLAVSKSCPITTAADACRAIESAKR